MAMASLCPLFQPQLSPSDIGKRNLHLLHVIPTHSYRRCLSSLWSKKSNDYPCLRHNYASFGLPSTGHERYRSKGSDLDVSIDTEEEEVVEEVEEEEEEETGDDDVKDNFRDAVISFLETDIEEAAKKYDMEEELFAEIDFAQINAFTDKPFGGNPAAVCYLPMTRDDHWLQCVAKQFNLSETAFLIKRDSGKRKSKVFKRKSQDSLHDVDEFDLRWFTPKVEVDLCGHATLASAHLLFSSGIADNDVCLFHTRSGVLKARKVLGYAEDEDDNSDDTKTTKRKRPTGVGVVELDFPLTSCIECGDPDEAKQLSLALGGAQIIYIGKTSMGDYLVEVSSTAEVEQIQPQFSSMMDFNGRGGVIVTAQAEKGTQHDFVSRFFCPKSGIFEDPVTGSAHCALGPFWARKLGKETLKGFQASERGGEVLVRVDENQGRAYIQGSAVLIMAGVLLNTSRVK